MLVCGLGFGGGVSMSAADEGCRRRAFGDLLQIKDPGCLGLDWKIDR